jgi:hypothetical protein
MSTRPTRQSAINTLTKIKDILAWETCSESSEAFKTVAARMEEEFANAKRRRVVAAKQTPTLAAADDDEEDHSDCDSDFDCDSDSEAGGSVPSSADLFSDPGESSEESEDDDEDCETNSSSAEGDASPV